MHKRVHYLYSIVRTSACQTYIHVQLTIFGVVSLYVNWCTFTSLILMNCGFEKAHGLCKVIASKMVDWHQSLLLLSLWRICNELTASISKLCCWVIWCDFWPLAIEIQVQILSPLSSYSIFLFVQVRFQTSGKNLWLFRSQSPTNCLILGTIGQSPSPASSVNSWRSTCTTSCTII